MVTGIHPANNNFARTIIKNTSLRVSKNINNDEHMNA
jgi:hypothetical protein